MTSAKIKQEQWTFFGTDQFSVTVLETLKTRGLLPTLVITTPDKPQGRHLTLTPSPAKLWAIKNNIEFIQPSSLKNLDSNSSLVIRNSSFSIVASYGKIIPQDILDLPSHGTLNIHPSLLPKYRGASPLETSILNGDQATGVTIIKLDAEMDHGPIVAQKELYFDHLPDYQELMFATAKAGAELLADNLDSYLDSSIKPKDQDHQAATYTSKIEKKDGLLDLAGQPEKAYRQICALSSWPGAYFLIHHQGKDLRVIVKKARLKDGKLEIERVVPEGKKEMDWESFKNGYRDSLL